MSDKQKAVIFEFMGAVLLFMAARVHPSEQLTLFENIRKVKADCQAEWSKLDIFQEQPPLQDGPKWEKP